MEAHKCSYISKPAEGSQGDGMQIFQTLKDLPLGLGREGVVQRYIDKPLLLKDKLKFDLRIYVVVVGVTKLKAFMCEEGLARFCTVRL
jgi:tubulin polyglutamylase TTLL11